MDYKVFKFCKLFQIIKIVDSIGHTVSIAAVQLCKYSTMKTVLDFCRGRYWWDGDGHRERGNESVYMVDVFYIHI
jgi:hypothetical protein